MSSRPSLSESSQISAQPLCEVAISPRLLIVCILRMRYKSLVVSTMRRDMRIHISSPILSRRSSEPCISIMDSIKRVSSYSNMSTRHSRISSSSHSSSIPSLLSRNTLKRSGVSLQYTKSSRRSEPIITRHISSRYHSMHRSSDEDAAARRKNENRTQQRMLWGENENGKKKLNDRENNTKILQTKKIRSMKSGFCFPIRRMLSPVVKQEQ